MASPSAQRGAARAPPPPDQLASFYKLVDKRVIAGVLCRDARSAELSAQAAVQAEALFGDNSLVVADLRMCESVAFYNLSVEASSAEKVALTRQTWNVLLSVIPFLLCRLEDDTLLPGTIREEEIDYWVYVQGTVRKATNKPVLPLLNAAASSLGYNILMMVMVRSLDLLPAPFWPQNERAMVESLVLQGLDVIPRTAGVPAGLFVYEEPLLAYIKEQLSPQHHGPAFCAAVLRKWRSDAVSSVLRSRGVLQTGGLEIKQNNAEFEARKRDDIAKHGLRDCSLPSCAKTEKTVKEFSLCAGCLSQVYCCLEHQALDWKAHKKACKVKAAARLAEEAAEEARAGAGAAGV